MQARYLVLAISLLLLAGNAGAQQAGPADHALFSGFPDSVISEFESTGNVNYRVVLGSLQSTRGQVAPEASERVRGNLTRILYEVSGGFTGQDVYDFLVEQMELRGYRELFSCTGRACGSSEYWANDIFGNRILYGPVRNQFYLAMGSEPPGQFFVSAYVITRINRQLLAYLEIIELEGNAVNPAEAEPSFLLEQLRETGGVVVPGLAFGAGDQLAADADLDAVAETAGAGSGDASVHCRPTCKERVISNSCLPAAKPVPERCGKRCWSGGIDAERLTARGLGPLAPLCAAADCAERVELVLQSADQ